MFLYFTTSKAVRLGCRHMAGVYIMVSIVTMKQSPVIMTTEV